MPQPTYYCFKCNIDLIDRPIIKVEHDLCCFKCAKKEVHKRESYEKNRVTVMNEREQVRYQNKVAIINKKRAKAHSENQTDKGCFGILLFASFFLLVCLFTSSKDTVWFVYFLCVAVVAFGWYINTSADRKTNDSLRKALNAIEPLPDWPTTEYIKPIQFEILQSRTTPKHRPPSDYRKQVLERDNYMCQNCGAQKAPKNLEVHHVKTQSKGGDDFLTNLVCLCISCHDREKWFGHIRKYPKTL